MREEVKFFQALESHMRNEDVSLVGRDHLMHRSYYIPVKGIMNEDLCERYRLLAHDKKQRIAKDLTANRISERGLRFDKL
ncbi:hypothetical protein Hte_007710 [Hypoxylon texense]